MASEGSTNGRSLKSAPFGTTEIRRGGSKKSDSKESAFTLSPGIYASVQIDFPRTTARKYVWNPPVSPIYNILTHLQHCVLAHPQYAKAIQGKKTDKRDAKWIADICKHDLESLILSTIEKYLPKLGLVMTAPGIQSFAAVGIIFEIGSVVFHI